MRRTYLESVYRYLVQRKYFKLVRQLLEEKVPPLYDVVISSPNSISDTLLQMIQHPLRLISSELPGSRSTTSDIDCSADTAEATPLLISNECATLILSSFVDEILVPEYTKPIRLFVIPCLANNVEFPFLHLLHYLSDLIKTLNAQPIIDYVPGDSSGTIQRHHHPHHKSCDHVFRSSYVFHSFLTLDQLHLDRIKSDSAWVSDYINVLGSLSENIRKLQQRSSHSAFRQYGIDMDADADDDFDSDDEDERKIETILPIERDCLFEVITRLNDEKRVELVLENIDNYLEDVHVLYSLCKICHNLMLYHRTAVFEFRFEPSEICISIRH